MSLEAQQKVYENDLKSMQDELQRKNDEYEKGKSTMNATVKQQKETEPAEPVSENTADLSGQSAEPAEEITGAMQPIVTKVRNAINAVGQAGGYTYIFEDGAAVYAGPTVKDVTSEVQAKLK